MAKWDLSLPPTELPMQCYHCGSKTLMRVVTEKRFSESLYLYYPDYGEVLDGTAWIKWQILKCPVCEKINVIESSGNSEDKEVIDIDENGNEAYEDIVKTTILFPITDLPPNPNTEKLLDIIDISDNFYKKLIDEINILYKHGLALSLPVLIRKLLENLLIDILRKKYGDSGKLLYYDTSKHRFLNFSTLTENFKNKQADFRYVINGLDNELINKIKSHRETGNSAAHSIDGDIKNQFFVDKRDEINHLVQFLFRLLKNIPS
jgi:hypothetical protein